jgi:hypothetical protein
VRNEEAGRALAAVYGPHLRFHGSIPRHQADDADLVIDTLRALDLLDEEGSRAWRERIRRLAADPAEPVEVPAEIRAAVRDQVRERSDRRCTGFDLVGARDWREKARDQDASVTGLRVARWYPLPVCDDPKRGVDVALLAVHEDGVTVDWYEPRLGPGAPLGTLGGEGIRLQDDAGTTYARAKGVAVRRGMSEVGHYPMSVLFVPAPPPAATRLDVRCDADLLARVELS